MSSIHEVLKQYWGYNEFRPLQEDIITSALSGKDTLALLPTGGGKSICFQVPALAQDGVCLVISPLIALMNDQVENLKSRGIPAIALTSALTFRELDLALENAMQGKYKFLYLSPERLKNDMLQERVKRMKVNLLAVDEAHCISQWGYDFRPPYLEINQFRQLIPNVPVLALTATATPKVVHDIQDKLDFKAKNVFQKSFKRSNLAYNVVYTENIYGKMLEILHRIKGTAIVYTRNRRRTSELASWLRQQGIVSSFYHAGLSAEEREKRQQQWLQNITRVMVCTNAFGMGIDKPDVRLVLHLELPDSPEAYFQEVGRAGRDGKQAFGVMIVGPSSAAELQHKYLDTFPTLAEIRHVYQALANYHQLATGTGLGMSFGFDYANFCEQYNLSLFKTHQTLNIIEKEGYISLSDGFKEPSRLMILADRKTLYDFQLRNPKYDVLVKTIVRSYGGLESEYGNIQETAIAQRMQTTPQNIEQGLLQLKKQGLVDYIPSNHKSSITYTMPRQEVKYLTISKENLEHRFEELQTRIMAMVNFATQTELCRSRFILQYFGEENSPICGSCDVCRRNKSLNISEEEYQQLKQDIFAHVQNQSVSSDELLGMLNTSADKAKKVLNHLLEEELLAIINGNLSMK